jgi:nitroimidazol reductase NimA-like FMN-containing flavoprotein (pyridoxamine 5'-phosphate oxidase superfamily)
MTDEELEAFLSTQRTARVATVSENGEPHVVPMWFVWSGGKFYMNTLKRSRRTKDLDRGSPTSVVIDAGYEYGELCGVTLYGTFEDATNLEELGQLFGDKYWQGMNIPPVKSHKWVAMTPTKIVSWDFKKIPAGRDKRLEAQKEQSS